jgi:signal transduction histidine kinase
VRNRIAEDLHDEIGSNLSSISIFSQVANEKTDHKSAELDSWLKKINEYTQSSLDAINDIVWMINSRNDRFENIISRMRILAAELIEARNYQLQMSLDESLNEVKLGMEERKNFYLIYKEALNNIVKYANCKTVKIELKWNRPVVHLTISDDGDGFDATTVEHGNGLLNMQKRAETLKGKLNIHSVPGNGTSVELDFNA